MWKNLFIKSFGLQITLVTRDVRYSKVRVILEEGE
jgi:hypothetical protein